MGMVRFSESLETLRITESLEAELFTDITVRCNKLKTTAYVSMFDPLSNRMAYSPLYRTPLGYQIAKALNIGDSVMEGQTFDNIKLLIEGQWVFQDYLNGGLGTWLFVNMYLIEARRIQ